MEATKQNTAPAKEALLAALRSLGRNRAYSMKGMRHVAEAQARVLRGVLPGPTHQFPDYLPYMFPNITVKYVASLPVAGLSFWNGHRWHIHIRKDDPNDERAFTLLHQIKRIIDHPLQRQTTRFTEADWHALADHFAHQVLNPISTQERKEASYERRS